MGQRQRLMASSLHNKFRLAMLGFAVTALFVVYQLLTEGGVSRDSAIMIVFVVLCPPSLLSVPMTNVEVGTDDFFVLWTVIGGLNAALYGTIAAMVGRRKKSA